MKIPDKLKKILSNKHYIFIGVFIIYVGLKSCVDHTDTDWDNRALEVGKSVMIEYLAEADDAPADLTQPVSAQRS